MEEKLKEIEAQYQKERQLINIKHEEQLKAVRFELK